MLRLLLFIFMLFQFSFTAQPNTDLLDKVVKEQQDIEYQKAVNYIKANYSEFAEMTTNEERLAKAIKLYRESRVDKYALILLSLPVIILVSSLVLIIFPTVRNKALGFYGDLSSQTQGMAMLIIIFFVLVFILTLPPLIDWIYWSLI